MLRFVTNLLLFSGLLFTAGPSAFAQDSDSAERPLPQNSLYVEIAGNGLIYSINYDRVFQDRFSARIGLAPYGSGDIAVPILGNYLLGSGPSRLELGLGVTLMSITFTFFDSDYGLDRVIGTANFAYRYQKPDGGIFFKAGFTPLFNGKGFLPWFGASLGYTLD
jgi:hypothetical protein